MKTDKCRLPMKNRERNNETSWRTYKKQQIIKQNIKNKKGKKKKKGRRQKIKTTENTRK